VSIGWYIEISRVTKLFLLFGSSKFSFRLFFSFFKHRS